MFTGSEIVGLCEELGVTHVVWVPDSAFGPWETELESARSVQLVRVCREGEAWPLAAGLLVGGKSPLVVMQTTGLFESGDALAKLPADRTPVLYCKTGVRSAEVLAIVKKAGFSDAVHLQGGIVAWANQLEPDMVMY